MWSLLLTPIKPQICLLMAPIFNIPQLPALGMTVCYKPGVFINFSDSFSFYSFRKVSTGFMIANFQLCHVTILNEITSTINPVPINIKSIIVVFIMKIFEGVINY